MSDKKARMNEKGFFGKLSNGDFGLSKTYWEYGVAVGIFLNVVTGFITSVWILAIVMLIYIAYETLVLMGVWRASNKYEGRKGWAVLAKISTVLGAIGLVIGLVSVVTLLFNA